MKKIVALDFGLKKVGVAISDATQSIALPLMTLEGGIDKVSQGLDSRKNEIEVIVIGLPLLMNGQKGDMALLVEKFAHELGQKLDLPIVLLDERLSSKHAATSLRETGLNRKKREEREDQVAALHLLQCYLARLDSSLRK